MKSTNPFELRGSELTTYFRTIHKIEREANETDEAFVARMRKRVYMSNGFNPIPQDQLARYQKR